MDATTFTQRNYDMTQSMIALTQATVTFRNRWGQLTAGLVFENADIEKTKAELDQGIATLAAMTTAMQEPLDAFIEEIEAEREAAAGGGDDTKPGHGDDTPSGATGSDTTAGSGADTQAPAA